MKRRVAMLALAAAAAFVFADAAQAAYIKPGISIDGVVPTADGTYSGYTYQNGVFTLTSARTYTFAGKDTSGKVRIVAAANCTIDLQEGFTLDLRARFSSSSAVESSPISISGSKTVTITGGRAYLYGGQGGPGIRVAGGQTLSVESSLTIYAYGGDSGAGIGSGSNEATGCGTIYLRGYVHAEGGYQACGIGLGRSSTGDGTIIVDGGLASVGAEGSYPAAGIGTSQNATGTMTINISAGIVNAMQHGGYGAAIGTGQAASGTCRINISGGLAQGNVDGPGGAGIGSGHAATGTTTINISGGRVVANGGGGWAGIGGGSGSKTPSVTISGGTVKAKGDPDSLSSNDIGAGQDGTGTAKAVVTGGSIVLSGGKGTLYRSSSSSTPLNCITVGNLGTSGYVDVLLTTSQGPYGSEDIKASDDGYIYLWVPPANYDNLMVKGDWYKADATAGDAVATLLGSGPPANDNFAKATVISGSSGRVVGRTACATRESGLKLIVGSNTYDADNDYSVWYSWTAPFSGRVRFHVESPDVDGSGRHLQIDAYTGTASPLQYAPDESTGVCTVEDDGFDGDYSAFTCTKGVTYKIIVYNVEGVFTLSWDSAEKAETFKVSSNDDGTATITGYKGTDGAVSIPSSFFGLQVTEIGYGAFLNQGGITSVTISEGVTTIGAEAFRNCSALKTITLPSSIRSIGQMAFLQSGLTSLTIPFGVTSIGDAAFVYCVGLTGVTIPSSVTSIGEYAFAACESLASVTVPSSVTSIGAYAFDACSGLTSVTIPSSVTSIGKAAFRSCSSLTRVTLPRHFEGNLDIEDVFGGCPKSLVITYADPSGTYTIKFHRYDASDEKVAAYAFDHGVATALPKLAKLGWARRGFDFKGWATSKANADAGKVWKTDGAVVSTATAAGKTLNVYAVWALKSDSYAIQFIRNDGAGTWRTVGFKYGEKTRLPSLANGLGWARRGYDFKGWALTTADASAGKVWKADWSYVATAAEKGKTLTVYAVWSLKAGYYQIKFNKNDGTGKWRSLGFAVNESVKLSTLAALGWTRAGVTFKGWASSKANADAKKVWKTDGATVKNAAAAGKTLNIYAIWE